MMGFGALIWIALLILIVWALVRWLGDRTSPTPPVASQPTALDVLQMRYARGEIDAATYEEMRARL